MDSEFTTLASPVVLHNFLSSGARDRVKKEHRFMEVLIDGCDRRYAFTLMRRDVLGAQHQVGHSGYDYETADAACEAALEKMREVGCSEPELPF